LLSFSYAKIYWDLKQKSNFAILSLNAFVLSLFSLQIHVFWSFHLSRKFHKTGSQPSGNFLVDTQEKNKWGPLNVLEMLKPCASGFDKVSFLVKLVICFNFK